MVRPKSTVRTMDYFKVVDRDKKKKILSVQNKTSPTTAKNCKYNQIVKTINVRRKSKYLNGRNALVF